MYMLEVYIFKWLKTLFVFFTSIRYQVGGFPGGSDGKESACNAADRIWVLSLGCEPSLEKGMATTLVFLPKKSHGQRRLAGNVHGVAKSWT